jgi:hypothetical protein
MPSSIVFASLKAFTKKVPPLGFNFERQFLSISSFPIGIFSNILFVLSLNPIKAFFP